MNANAVTDELMNSDAVRRAFELNYSGLCRESVCSVSSPLDEEESI